MKFMNRTMIKSSNKIKKRKEKNPPNDDRIYQHPNLSIFIRNSFHGLRYTSKYLICKWGWCFFHMIWDIIFKHESAEKSQCHLVQGITVMNQDTIYIDCWLYFFVSVFGGPFYVWLVQQYYLLIDGSDLVFYMYFRYWSMLPCVVHLM